MHLRAAQKQSVTILEQQEARINGEVVSLAHFPEKPLVGKGGGEVVSQRKQLLADSIAVDAALVAQVLEQLEEISCLKQGQVGAADSVGNKHG